MRAKGSVFIAATLDGFIARSDGSIDWLNEANKSVPTGEDCGFAQFMSSIDVLIMGRNTFEQVLEFNAWPYGSTPVVVLSHRKMIIPSHLPETVSASSETPEDIVERLSAAGAKRLYIDGGLTIQSFISAGLIDDITVTTIPVLIGTGKQLFGPLETDVLLTHERTLSYPFGFVQNTYRVNNDA